jgi:4-aminobutyrate aminotransferase-like enzyme
MGAVAARDEVATVLEGSGFMYFTFTGNDASCAAALTVLDILEREQLVERSRVMGEVLGARLRDALSGHRAVLDIRGRGLFYGIEIDVSRDEVVMEAISRGLWVYPAGSGPVANAVMVAPPFVVTDAEIDQIVDTLAASLEAVVSR